MQSYIYLQSAFRIYAQIRPYYPHNIRKVRESIEAELVPY